LHRTAFFEPNRELIYLRDLFWQLIRRDLKGRYQGSVLGVAWTLITPLFLLVVYQFVFKEILGVEVPRFGSYAFSGILCYTWFQASIIQSAISITGSRDLVTFPGFPTSILPVVSVATNFIYFSIAFFVFLLFLLAFGKTVELTVLALPLVLVIQFILTLGLCYLVASINVFFRDTQHILGLLLHLLLFLSPIFYEAKAVPEPYQALYNLNPLVHLLEAYRSLLFKGSFSDWIPLLVIGVGAILLLYYSFQFFLHMSYRFVEEI